MGDSPAQAVEVSPAGRVPDLVISDLGVARADEMDTLAAVRRRFGSVPLLVVSARGWEEVRRAALAAGADDFLPKPFPIDALLGQVAAVLPDRALVPVNAATGDNGR